MSLSNHIRTGPASDPLRIVLQGVEGIGKTTFASKAPGVLFLSPEDGGGDLDTSRIVVADWKAVIARVRDLLDEPHDYRVLALDTINALERLCWAHVMAENGVSTIEAVGGGFGKGYTAATEEQTRLVKLLDELREKRRMHILALGHTEIRTFSDPEGANYDRYQLRMHKGAAGLWGSWADCTLFANYDVQVKTEKGGGDAALLKKGKALTKPPERILYTERRAAFDAKNRYNLPPELPLSWDAFATAIRWTERETAVLNTRPAPRAWTGAEVRQVAIDAFRNRDWLPEHVTALCARWGAEKPEAIPEEHRAEAVTALRGAPPTHTEAK